MQLFTYLLEVNPLGFWFLVGVIFYPPIIIIIFAIIEKIKERLTKRNK